MKAILFSVTRQKTKGVTKVELKKFAGHFNISNNNKNSTKTNSGGRLFRKTVLQKVQKNSLTKVFT